MGGEPPEDFKKKSLEKNLEAKRNRAKAAVSKKERGRERDRTKEGGRDDRSRSRRATEDKEEEDEKPDKEAPAEKEGEDAEETTQEVELTDEEKKWWFFRSDTEDIPRKDLSSSFSRFGLPEEGEGFDEIRYAWQPRDACVDYLTQWMAEKKLTQRVEEIVPGSWFRAAIDEWQSLFTNWKRKEKSWKDSSVRLREGPGSWRQKSAKQNGSKRANLRPNAKKQEEQKRQEEEEKSKEDKKAEEDDVKMDEKD